MDLVVTVLHVFACVFLVAVVLLQRGKGAQIGAVFGGGGGGTMFGSRGAGNFLTKLTTAAAVVFMLTSLSLSYLGLSQDDQLLFEEGAVEEPAAGSLFEEIEGGAAGTALDPVEPTEEDRTEVP